MEIQLHTWLRYSPALILVLAVFELSACKFINQGYDDDPLSSADIIVPDDQPSIQAGIDAADRGDLVIVRPGIYLENINLHGKPVTLASMFILNSDAGYINQTIIDGQGETVITANQDAGNSTISGFTIRNGIDGVSASAILNINNNFLTQNGDGIDYESGGGGSCSGNVFMNNRDDAVDLDGAVAVSIDNNLIQNNGDDGIEIRLHDYNGETLLISITGNTISGNAEDGIQIIDYDGISDRLISIQRNIIDSNLMAGIGMMANGNTIEDYSGAPIPEPIYIFNNDIVDNSYGLTGGSSTVILNNIFSGSLYTAIRNAAATSVATYNLFWNNGTDFENSNVDLNTTLNTDPLLDSDYVPMVGSPVVDAGISSYTHNATQVLNLLPSDYTGLAPDIGAKEGQ